VGPCLFNARKLQQYYDVLRKKKFEQNHIKCIASNNVTIFFRKKKFEQNHIKCIASNILVTYMTQEVSANQIYCKVVANLHYPLSSSESEIFLVCPMRDQGKDHVSLTPNCNSDTEPGKIQKKQYIQLNYHTIN
jgi:hypothetical protein